MKIDLPTTLTVELSDEDLGDALWRRAYELTGVEDDAGCDWYTDDNGNTYINADWNWQVSSDPVVAAMIDLHHILTGSPPRKFKMEEAADEA